MAFAVDVTSVSNHLQHLKLHSKKYKLFIHPHHGLAASPPLPGEFNPLPLIIPFIVSPCKNNQQILLQNDIIHYINI